MKTLLIIPAHNEQDSIENTLQKVISAGYDYVVINDGSMDKTAKILNQNNYNHIDLLFNLGIGGAVQTGYKYAYENNYDIAIQFDADGQHDITSIKNLIAPIEENKADFTIGSRFIDKKSDNFKSSIFRRIGIKLISNVIFIFTKKRIYDTTSGFRAANKKIIKYFSENYPCEYPEPVSDFELLKLNFKVKEVSTKMHKRTQ